MTKSSISLSAIEAQVAVETPVDFEPYDKNGAPSGIVLKVLSDRSPSVQEGVVRLENEQRRKAQVTAAKARSARPGEVFVPVEEDVLQTRKLTALRVAGWDGLDEPCTPDNVVRLLTAIPSFIPQILDKAADLGGFTTTSSKA